MTYPFAEVVHDGSSWMVFVGGKALDGNPFKGISWKSKVEIINSAHDKAVREAVAERDDRIAELERVLEELVNSFNSVVSYSSDYYSLADYEAGIPQRWTIDAKIKSVLGRGE